MQAEGPCPSTRRSSSASTSAMWIWSPAGTPRRIATFCSEWAAPATRFAELPSVRLFSRSPVTSCRLHRDHPLGAECELDRLIIREKPLECWPSRS